MGASGIGGGTRIRMPVVEVGEGEGKAVGAAGMTDRRAGMAVQADQGDMVHLQVKVGTAGLWEGRDWDQGKDQVWERGWGWDQA